MFPLRLHSVEEKHESRAQADPGCDIWGCPQPELRQYALLRSSGFAEVSQFTLLDRGAQTSGRWFHPNSGPHPHLSPVLFALC